MDGRNIGDVPTRRYTSAPSSLLPPGTVLNGIYRIERQLGAGGMGEVYLALNIENGEYDAIKVMAPALVNDTVVEDMFRREAKALRAIHSPAIAQIRVFAREPRLGLLYMATEYVEGPSLGDVMKRGPADIEAVVALVRRVATGMKAAHNANRVHRDLSPDNIIIPNGDPACAKVIDFGIVKDLDPQAGTRIGASLAGKPAFMAPEQFGESGSRIGPWTDVYSLALVGIAFAAGEALDLGGTIGAAMERRRCPINLTSLPAALQPLFASMLTYDWRERAGSMDAVIAGLATVREPPLQVERSTPAPIVNADLPAEISVSPGMTIQSDPAPGHVSSRSLMTRARKAGRGVFAIGAFGVVLGVAVIGYQKAGTGSATDNTYYDGPADNSSASEPNPQRPEPPPSALSPDAPIVTTATGLKYQQMRAGTGTARPKGNDVVRISYVAHRANGTSDRAPTPTYLELSKLGAGLREGLQLMTPGSRFRFWVPAKLARPGAGEMTFEGTLAEFVSTAEYRRRTKVPMPSAVTTVPIPPPSLSAADLEGLFIAPEDIQCPIKRFIVFFEIDKSDVTPEAAEVLKNAVKYFNSCYGAKVDLVGHTDRSGSAAYNVGLSQRMSDAVKAYLVSKGIPDGAVATQASGESHPRVETNDGVREVQNRRVEVMVGG